MTTKVKPSVLNDTSVNIGTYGGQSTVPVFTVDQQGRLTYAGNAAIAIDSTQISSIANTQITGLITSGQIATVANTQITGLITNGQIASVANTKISGLITSGQIATVANTQITGLITSAQISSVSNTAISGTIPVSQISGKLGLGLTGEVWNNVTGSRGYGITYTNSRSYPIQIATVGTHDSGASHTYFYVNGNNIWAQGAQWNGPGAQGGGGSIIVPPGATYMATSYQNLSTWWELY